MRRRTLPDALARETKHCRTSPDALARETEDCRTFPDGLARKKGARGDFWGISGNAGGRPDGRLAKFPGADKAKPEAGCIAGYPANQSVGDKLNLLARAASFCRARGACLIERMAFQRVGAFCDW